MKRKTFGRALSCRKGSVADVVFVIVALVMFGLVSIVAYIILNSVNTNIQAANPNIVPNETKQIMENNTAAYPSLFNSMFFFLFIGLSIGAVISAFFVQTHPILFIVLVLGLAVFVFVAMLLSNVTQPLLQDPLLPETAEFGTMIHFFLYMPYYILIDGLLITIALITRPKDYT